MRIILIILVMAITTSAYSECSKLALMYSENSSQMDENDLAKLRACIIQKQNNNLVTPSNAETLTECPELAKKFSFKPSGLVARELKLLRKCVKNDLESILVTEFPKRLDYESIDSLIPILPVPAPLPPPPPPQ